MWFVVKFSILFSVVSSLIPVQANHSLPNVILIVTDDQDVVLDSMVSSGRSRYTNVALTFFHTTYRRH